MQTHIILETPIAATPRVLQVRGMFDLPPDAGARIEWDVQLPLEERPWLLGLIVGPSGCGKSTIARHLWPEAVRTMESLTWDAGRAILDDFPAGLPIRDVVALLSSVGFSSPPAWLRPFAVLSTGQKFRAALARLIAEARVNPPSQPIVFDEYTSVVDRTVAQVGSAAAARALRTHDIRFVAVTCHEDVEPWLNPDWVYRPAERHFAWRLLQRRPAVGVEVFRCQATAWQLFAPHHYLSAALNRSAACFLAIWHDQPVAFSAWLPFVGRGPRARREHRTVTLPDFQGIGIGNALSAAIAAMWRGLGFRAVSTTTHPAMIRARLRSPLWRLKRRPSFAGRHERRLRHAVTRLTAGFEYVGPALNPHLARALYGH
jgi:GNAT superfamily N-acetyltransferase